MAFPDPELPELCSCPNQSPSQPPGDGVGDDNEDGDDNDGDDNDDNDNDKDDGRAQRLLLLCGWLHHSTDLILSAAEPNFDYAVIGNHQAG